jgi:8-oxo-dGTP pyrophosphatase MutT (NUDIX family)
MKKIIIDKLALVEIKNRRLLMALSKGKDKWYIPGGKREGKETDIQALIREIKEEMNVDIDSCSAKFFNTYVAEAHDKPKGTLVRVICFTASYSGQPSPSAEIEKLAYLSHCQRHLTPPLGVIILNDLKAKGLID